MATNPNPTSGPVPGYLPPMEWQTSHCLNKACKSYRIDRQLVASAFDAKTTLHWVATCRDCGCTWTEVTNIK